MRAGKRSRSWGWQERPTPPLRGRTSPTHGPTGPRLQPSGSGFSYTARLPPDPLSPTSLVRRPSCCPSARYPSAPLDVPHCSPTTSNNFFFLHCHHSPPVVSHRTTGPRGYRLAACPPESLTPYKIVANSLFSYAKLHGNICDVNMTTNTD